jgi:hypothetical protein
MAELARLFLCIPASQVECERIFSVAGQLTGLLRNRMSVEKLAMMVYLYKNLNAEAICGQFGAW